MNAKNNHSMLFLLISVYLDSKYFQGTTNGKNKTHTKKNAATPIGTASFCANLGITSTIKKSPL